MHNWFLAILAEKDIITAEEAEHLSKELATSIYSTRYSDAQATIKRIFKEYNSSK